MGPARPRRRRSAYLRRCEALALCGLGQPDNAEKRLLDATALRAPGDRVELRTTIYDLLSDPPLPGIDRLRTIIDNDT